MRVYVKKSFLKDIDKLHKATKKDVLSIIEKIKNAESLFTWPNIKKLKGHKHFYRIRLGKYRIGFEIREDTIIFYRVLHRRDLYRYFPE